MVLFLELVELLVVPALAGAHSGLLGDDLRESVRDDAAVDGHHSRTGNDHEEANQAAGPAVLGGGVVAREMDEGVGRNDQCVGPPVVAGATLPRDGIDLVGRVVLLRDAKQGRKENPQDARHDARDGEDVALQAEDVIDEG